MAISNWQEGRWQWKHGKKKGQCGAGQLLRIISFSKPAASSEEVEKNTQRKYSGKNSLWTSHSLKERAN